MKRLLFASSMLALAAAPAQSQDPRPYSPALRSDVPRQVFWGDTHLHTRLSADAYAVGNTALGPETAFRLARGETVAAQNGQKVKLQRPLDFLVVSDHAEYMGVIAGVQDKDPPILGTGMGARLRAMFDSGDVGGAVRTFLKYFTDATGGVKSANISENARHSMWNAVSQRADRFNSPGRFTAFVGYEYTSIPQLQNLHRNVIFRDGAERTTKVLPFSAIDSYDAEDLWAYLADYEAKTGGSVLAIPHNSNISLGRMFDTVRYNGDPITADYARTRMRWEPIVEATQLKGDSETHPLLSPSDEFADYETWNTLLSVKSEPEGEAGAKWRKGLPGDYVRSALRRGLEFEQKLGVNPYKFGMIGSTDAHTSLTTSEEDNFWGKFTPGHPSPTRWKDNSAGGKLSADEMPDAKPNTKSISANWIFVASGLAAVWARENTREALFDSMRRKEVYATTGTRMTVRFFGGWDYADNADKRRDYVDIGYDGGVPMGGDLTKAASGKKPKFLVLAAKDPDGANLDRVQVIKGWVDKAGKSHEKVYDVAWSGNREKDAKGKVPAVGSTVDLKTAMYTNTIGAPILSTVWTDPDFDAGQRAFYYVRVIEIPTPRWTDYDAAFYKVTIPDFVPMTTQERAYTSPIWYTP